MVPPDRKRTATLFDEGHDALLQLFACLPKVRVIMAMGRNAQQAWRRLERKRPLVTRKYRLFQTLHTSGLGITNGSRQRAEVGEAEVCRAMHEALALIDQ